MSGSPTTSLRKKVQNGSTDMTSQECVTLLAILSYLLRYHMEYFGILDNIIQ